MWCGKRGGGEASSPAPHPEQTAMGNARGCQVEATFLQNNFAVTVLHCRCPKMSHQRFGLSHLSASAAPRQARLLPGPHHRLEGLQSHLSPSSSSKHRKISVLKLHVRSYRRGKRPLLTKSLSKLICAFPPTLAPSEAPEACVQVVGPGSPLWHRGQGALSHLHYVFGVPLEWQQETCFWTDLYTLQKPIALVLLFLPGLTWISGSSRTSLSISVTNFHKCCWISWKREV